MSREVMSRYPWMALTGSPLGLVTVGGVEKNARYMRLEVSSRMRVVIGCERYLVKRKRANPKARSLSSLRAAWPCGPASLRDRRTIRERFVACKADAVLSDEIE